MEVKKGIEDFLKGYALGIASGLIALAASPFIITALSQEYPLKASYLEVHSEYYTQTDKPYYEKKGFLE